MAFLKRIAFFFLLNVAVIATIGVVGFILQTYFGITLSPSLGQGVIPLLMFSLLYGFAGSTISLWISRWMAKRSYDIRLITESDLHRLSDKERIVYDTVTSIAQQHRITTPEIGIYDDLDPNAFATGPTKNRALVAVSSGLLDGMSSDEIRGVVAHEMAHILNGDMVTSTLLQGIINAFVIFFARVIAYVIDQAFRKNDDGEGLGSMAYYLIVMVLENVLFFAGYLVIMWHSRTREYAADKGGAQFVGKDSMIRALTRLQGMTAKTEVHGTSDLATMKISTRDVWSLLASHPPLEQRIEALRSAVGAF